MHQICDIDKCTGCHACFNICPKHCIDMNEDDYGFVYPHINEDMCIDCHLCEKTCPVNLKSELVTPAKTYAAINKNEHDYKTSTSGGLATRFARWAVESGGSAYGAAICDDLKVRHIRVVNEKGIERIKGSKYVQSEIGDCYTKVKEDLNAGKKVVFIGTPCQVSGLKRYLKKDYTDLFTCDIVCHGVPSVKMINEHFAAKNVTGYDSYTFRDKDGFFLAAKKNDENIYRKRNFLDVFYLGFLKGAFYRECCYSCDYAGDKRVGDITLGDFWGFDREKGSFPVSTSCGLSLVGVNTQKGEAMFDACKNELVCIEREWEEAVAGNKQLRHPSVRHKNNGKFKAKYLTLGFEKAANSALWKERIIYGILDKAGR